MTDRSPEERAEEVMERLAREGSRRLNRFLGRAREEFEDIVAEARTLNNQRARGRSGRSSVSSRTGSSGARSRTPSGR